MRRNVLRDQVAVAYTPGLFVERRQLGCSSPDICASDIPMLQQGVFQNAAWVRQLRSDLSMSVPSLRKERTGRLQLTYLLQCKRVPQAG